MYAIEIAETGGRKLLHYVDVPTPTPGPGGVGLILMSRDAEAADVLAPATT